MAPEVQRVRRSELLSADDRAVLAMRMRKVRRGDARGQAMVEFALAAPLFFLVLVGIIVLGLVVYYTQQLTNAAREAAWFAAVHSASAQCPVVGNLNPVSPGLVSTDVLTGHTAAWAAPDWLLRSTPCRTWAAPVWVAASTAAVAC